MCSVPLSVLPQPAPAAHDVLILHADTQTLIALCQESLSQVLSAMFQRYEPLAVTGQYDCQTASSMVAIADLVGADTSAVTSWPLGLQELQYLLGSSRRVQNLVREAMPSKSGGAVALKPGYLAPALPPVGCAGPIGTNGTSGGAAVVAYGDQPEAVSGNGPKKTGGWALPIAVGLALGAAGALAYAGSTQRRGYNG
jgi:hypothetical protein